MRSVATAVWDLLVEDGSLAVGIVVILVVTWAASGALGDEVGWLLLALITALLVLNLIEAGRRARRAIA